MSYLIVSLCLAALGSAAHQSVDAPGNYLATIVIAPDAADAAEADAPWKFSVSSSAWIKRDLELGQSVENAVVELSPAGEGRRSFRLQVQYETSISIMNEGPHLDLLGWKHYTSGWRDAESLETHRFRVPTFTDEERTRFPKLDPGELIRATLAAGGEVWASLVRNVTDPLGYPATVAISTIRLRVLVRSDEGWKDALTLAFNIPMGC